MALIGGYTLSQLLSVALLIHTPLTEADKTLSALMLAFVFFSIYALWVFSGVELKAIIYISSLVAFVSGLIVWSGM